MSTDKQKTYLFDNPRNVRRVVHGLVGACVILAGLDLVLIAPEAEPPVVKVMDYGKHLFELKKTKEFETKKIEIKS